MLVDASKHGVFKYSAYNLVICKPLDATLGSNLTPKPFSVSFPRTHYQGYSLVLLHPAIVWENIIIVMSFSDTEIETEIENVH